VPRANAPGVTCGRRTGNSTGLTSMETAGNINGRNELRPAADRFTPPLASTIRYSVSRTDHLDLESPSFDICYAELVRANADHVIPADVVWRKAVRE
jgi:hypothetical protein